MQNIILWVLFRRFWEGSIYIKDKSSVWRESELIELEDGSKSFKKLVKHFFGVPRV